MPGGGWAAFALHAGVRAGVRALELASASKARSEIAGKRWSEAATTVVQSYQPYQSIPFTGRGERTAKKHLHRHSSSNILSSTTPLRPNGTLFAIFLSVVARIAVARSMLDTSIGNSLFLGDLSRTIAFIPPSTVVLCCC